MADLTDALRASYVDSIQTLKGHLARDISEWLQMGDYKFESDVTSERKFKLRDSLTSLVEPFGYELARLSTVSFESIANLEPNSLLKKSTAWLVIRCYYGAFFSAHALMRLFGVAVVAVDSSIAKRLGEIAVALSQMKVGKIDSGYYVVDVARDAASSEAVAGCRRRDLKGGAHALAWVVFGELLKRLADDIIARSAPTSPDRLVVKKLDTLRQAIRGQDNNFRWLSDMRNTVNYVPSPSAWFPFTGTRRSDIEAMFRGANLWRSDAMSIDVAAGSPYDLKAFVRCCAFIAAMCRELVEDIDARSQSATRSFVSYGPKALLAQMYPRGKK